MSVADQKAAYKVSQACCARCEAQYIGVANLIFHLFASFME